MAATKPDYGANWWALLAIPAAAAATQTPTATISWPVFASLAVILLAFALVSWAAPGGPAWGRLKKRNTIPGPRGWPLVGSLMVMGERAHTRLASLAASHGAKRLMSFSLGDTLAIVASHPDVAKEILNSSAFADRPIKESAYQLMFDRAIGFAPYTEYWRNLRRIAATHLFSPRRISAFEKYRQSAVSSVLFAVDNNMQTGGVVVVRDILQTASLNNVMHSVFGRSYDFGSGNAEAKELQGMVREGYELLGVFNWGDHLTLMNFLDLQGIRKRCKSLVPRVNAFVKKIIDDHRVNPCVNSAESDFVDVLLSMQGNDRLAESDMIAVLWEMIFRGADTVAILLEWILARLVMHADIQEKIHRELDKVVGNSRKLTETDIPKLGYLQAVVKETLRVHPPGPLLSWARLAIHDVKVDGHMVPAGTTAMVNMWSITHDSSVWESPLEFKPERFVLESGGEDVNVMGSDLRLAPFGSGRRVCPGKALGLATVHLWLARLLHHYEFLPSDSEHAIDLSEVLKLSCELKTPLAVKAVRRNELEFL